VKKDQELVPDSNPGFAMMPLETVNIAVSVVVLPSTLVTTHLKAEPVSARTVDFVVYEGPVAPGMSAPLLRH
jgi:hypothetical protein